MFQDEDATISDAGISVDVQNNNTPAVKTSAKQSIADIDNEYYTLFNQTSTCVTVDSNGDIAPKEIKVGESCQINANIKFKEGVSQAFSIKGDIKYAPTNSLDKEFTAYAESRVNVTDIAVVLTYSNVPSSMQMGNSYPFSLDYTNMSGDGHATGFSVNLANDKGISNLTNTCNNSTTLNPNQTCKLSGTITPNQNNTDDNNTLYNFIASMQYNEGDRVISSYPIKISDVNLNTTVSKGLPENTQSETSYPIIFELKNNGNEQASGLKYTISNTDQFTETTSNCVATLDAASTCQIVGMYTTSAADTQNNNPVLNALTLSVFDNSGNTAKATTQSQTLNPTDNAILNADATGMPNKIAFDDEAPKELIFTFTNTGETASGTLSTSLSDNLVEISDLCTTKTLAPNESCAITATYTPSALIVGDTIIASATVSDTTQTVSAQTQTEVVEVIDQAVLSGEIFTLLNGVLPGDTIPVSFQITNIGTLPATEVAVTPSANITGLSGACIDSKTIAIGESCIISGSYTAPETEGSDPISIDVSYDEDKNESISAIVNVTNLIIEGSIDKKLPENTGKDQNAQFIFSYTNKSAIDDITNVTSSIAGDYKDDATFTNNCSGTIKAGSFCEIIGYVDSSDLGDKTIVATLDYEQNDGDPIKLTTQTAISSVAISAVNNQPLPQAMQPGSIYPFKITFTNNGTAEATNVTSDLNGTDLALIKNLDDTCADVGTLAAQGGSCYIAGQAAPEDIGSFALQGKLTYAQGEMPFLLQSVVSNNGVITATAYVELPVNVEQSATDTYPVSLVFQNVSTSPAPITDVTGNFADMLTPESLNNTCSDLISGNLAVGASCHINGKFMPSELGASQVNAIIEYGPNQSKAEASTFTTVSATALVGKVKTYLPKYVQIGDSYPFSLQIENKSDAEAANLVFTQIGMNEVVWDTTTTDSCINIDDQFITSLDANSSCFLTGTYSPTQSGDKTLELAVNYDGGNPVLLDVNSFVTKQMYLYSVLGNDYSVSVCKISKDDAINDCKIAGTFD